MKINIQESCPRDGWQNHREFIPTDVKVKYILQMLDYGAKNLEVTSFVNPKIMPQMVDAAEVISAVKPMAKEKGCKLSALALNSRGAEQALNAGADVLEFVLSASEEHNLRNSHRSLAESVQQFKGLVGHKYEAEIVLAIACFFGSPFGDEITTQRMKWILEEAMSVGVTKFGLADTAGICNPMHMRHTLQFLKEMIPAENISIHLHDTYGMGIANAYVALEEGFVNFDAALAGMGGCPFALGAKGNIATEDLVYLCDKLGYKTDYDLSRLVKVSHNMCSEIGAQNRSTVSKAMNCAG